MLRNSRVESGEWLVVQIRCFNNWTICQLSNSEQERGGVESCQLLSRPRQKLGGLEGGWLVASGAMYGLIAICPYVAGEERGEGSFDRGSAGQEAEDGGGGLLKDGKLMSVRRRDGETAERRGGSLWEKLKR